MEITIAIASILAITLIVWFANKTLPFRICPICAGVSTTWLWIMVGIIVGSLEAEIWELIVATTMGGSIVGVAYQLELYFSQPLRFKVLFIPTGFVVVWSILLQQWLIFSVTLGALAIVTVAFFAFARKKDNSDMPQELPQSGMNHGELEERMKRCC